MQGIKEKTSDAAASAKSGMEKARATAEEKAERMTTRDPVEKEMAREKRDVRVTQAELDKQATREHNAAARHTGTGTGTHGYTTTGGTGGADYLTGEPGYTTGEPGYTTGEPGYTTGQPTHPQTGGVRGSQAPPSAVPPGEPGDKGY